MRFIPTHCDACARPGLVAANQIIDGAVTCTDCGAPAHALPGESYAEQDVTLFADIAAALREAGITPAHAALLGTELEARSLLEPGRCLRRLAQALPSLGLLELLAGGEPGEVRKVEGMVATLLDTMARSPTQSGVVETAGRAAKASGDLPRRR